MSSEHSCTSAVNSTEQQAAAQCALVPPGQAQQAWAPQQGPAAKGLQPGAQAPGGPAMAAGISQQMGTDAPAHMFPSTPTVPMLPGFAAPPGLHTPMPGWGFPGPWMYPFQMPPMAAAGMYPMGMYGMASLMYQQQQQVLQQQALLMQQQAACGAHLPVMGGPMPMAMPGQAQAQAAAMPPGMPFPQPQPQVMPGTVLGSNQHLPGLAPAAQAAAAPAAALPMPLQQQGMPPQVLPPQLDPSSMPMGVAAAGPMGMPITTPTAAAAAAPTGPTAATMGSAAATPTAAAAAEKAAAGSIAAAACAHNKNAPSASSSASTAPTPATAAAAPAAPPPPPPFPMLAPRSSMPAPGPVPLARAPSSSSKQLPPPPMAAPLLGDLVGDPPTTSAPDATMWASDDMDDAQLGATSPNGDGDGERAAASAPAGEAGAPAPPLHTIILPPITDPDAKVALPMLIPGWPMPRVAITTAAPAAQGGVGAGERPEGAQSGSSRNSSELKQEQGLQPQPQITGPVVFVAARRAAAILRRREQRARLAAAGQLTHGIRVRKPYMHQSRHDHAQRRIRGPGGRFLSAQEKAALLAEEAGGGGGPPAAAGASGGPSTANVKQEPGHGTTGKGADADGGPGTTKKGPSAAGSKKPKASKTFAGLPTAAAGQASPASPKGSARSKAAPARVNSTVSAPAAPNAALRVPSTPGLQAMGLPPEGEVGEGGQAGAALLAPPPPAPSRARAKRGASKSRPDSPPNVPHTLDDQQQQLFFRAASDSLLTSEAAGVTRPSPGSSAGKGRLQRAETGPLRSRPGGGGSGSTKKLARTVSCVASSPSPSPSASEPSSAAKHSGGAGRTKAHPPRRHASSLPAVLPLPLPQCVLADTDAPGGGKDEGGEAERLPDDPALAPLELSHIVDAAAGVVGSGGVDSSLGLQPLGGHALDFVARGPLGAPAGPPAGTQGHDADEEDLLLLMAGDLMHDIWGPGALVPEGLPQDGAGPSGTQPGRGQPAAS